MNPWATLLAYHYRDLLRLRLMAAQGLVPTGRVNQQAELVESLWNAYREHQGTYSAAKPASIAPILRQPPKARLTARQQLALA